MKELLKSGWGVHAVNENQLVFANANNRIALYSDVYPIDFWEKNIPYNEKEMILNFADEFFEGADYKSKMVNELRSAVAACLIYKLMKMDFRRMHFSVHSNAIHVNFSLTECFMSLSLDKREIKFCNEGEFSEFMVESVNYIENIYNKVMDRFM